jgi:hypothetical protein
MNLVVERELGDADAGDAPTTPEMSVATATHAAANPPRTL